MKNDIYIRLEQSIENLKGMTDDDEAAHGYEDSIREDVLEAIAEGKLTKKDMVALAKLALTTGDIKFSRWCA